ncbi:MAG: choice-of-anchor J domain-containing protein [Ferruginibacter sp.]
MRKSMLRLLMVYAVVQFLMLQSCKDDSYLTQAVSVPDQSFSESFDDFQEAYNKGWRAINRSFPLGRKWYDVTETPIITSPNYVAIYYPEWNQAQFTLDSLQFGLNTPFPKRYWEVAYSSQRASNGYVATSRASAELINLTGPSTRYNVNNWLVSPEVILQNGDKISFYTFCRGVARLQLWVNPTNTLEVGSIPSDLGDFSIKLLDINPSYAAASSGSVKAFPQYWTRFEGSVSGLASPVKGRFGFRYLLEDVLPSNATTVDDLYNELHQSVIGIDAVTYTSQPK